MTNYKSILVVVLLITLSACAPVGKNTLTPKVPIQTFSQQLGPTDNAYYRYLLAQLAKSDGQLEKAAKEIEKAIAFDSESVYLKKELASLY